IPCSSFRKVKGKVFAISMLFNVFNVQFEFKFLLSHYHLQVICQKKKSPARGGRFLSINNISLDVARDNFALQNYQEKCEKALLASAMRCVSSLFLTALPSFLEAAINSSASLMAIGLPFPARAALISQRIASANLRSGRTSLATW